MDKPIHRKGWNPMSKLILSEAVELVPVGKSKRYQDVAEGIISTDIFLKKMKPI